MGETVISKNTNGYISFWFITTEQVTIKSRIIVASLKKNTN